MSRLSGAHTHDTGPSFADLVKYAAALVLVVVATWIADFIASVIWAILVIVFVLVSAVISGFVWAVRKHKITFDTVIRWNHLPHELPEKAPPQVVNVYNIHLPPGATAEQLAPFTAHARALPTRKDTSR